jgi:outer membrane protein W
MKKTMLLLLFACFICTSSCAQLEKGNWLVGGSGSFSSAKTRDVQDEYSTARLNLSANLGYFFLNKFATGLILDYRYTDIDTYDNPNYFGGYNSSYNIGPFLKYYFLPIESPVNIFFQTDYGLQFERNNLYLKNLTIKAGPVLYLNSSVGLEFNIGYSNIKNNDNKGNTNSILMGLGFQIHLKK